MKKITILVFLIVLMSFGGLLTAGDRENKEEGKWSLNLSVLALAPQLETWPFISVTHVYDLGYDMHPSCEGVSPGVRVGAEYRVSRGLGLELSAAYGVARTKLNAEGGYVESTTDKKSLSYFNLLVNLPIYFDLGKTGLAYFSPHCGFGRLSSVTSFTGYYPEITFGGNSGFIYGGKIGILWGKKRLVFTELGYTFMDITVKSEQENLEVNRSFGPLFISAGIRIRL